MLTKTFKRIAVAAVATVSAVTAAGIGSAPASAQVAGDIDVVAVVGYDDGLWVKYSNEANYRNLGGRLIETPSIVPGYDREYFVAVGGDGNVWVRSLARNWQPMAPAHTRCSGASAVISVDKISVACRGTDGAMWFSESAAPTGDALPFVSSFRSLGGFFKAGFGTSVADAAHYDTPGPQALTSVVGIGGDSRPYKKHQSGWFLFSTAVCGATYSQSEYAEAGVCKVTTGPGPLHVDAVNGRDYTTSGAVVGRSAITVGSDGGARIFGLGTDGQIWIAHQPFGGAPGGFSRYGGGGKYGVAAVTI